MKKQMNKRNLIIAALGIVLIAACAVCGLLSSSGKAGVTSSDVVILDAPDTALLGGWVFKNPDNEYELLAFEFGPDSTFIVMNYADGEQVGETMKGKCVYLKIRGYNAIEMTLDNDTNTMHYYYQVIGDYATFTNAETGEIMPLQLVKKVKLAE